MNLDDDDSVFEQALRADLPSLSEQNRLRQRILAAGIAAGTALGSTNVAAAAQASFGASALSKLSALSWPAKLGLAAVIAAPVAGVALPLASAYEPVHAGAIVQQVRSRAATVRAQASTKATLSRAQLLPLEAALGVQAERGSEPVQAQPNVVARPSALTAGNLPMPVAANPNPPANGSLSAAQQAVAAFDSVAHDAPASGLERPRDESTLAAETQLLDRAFAALAAGDRGTATSLIAEHARRFPNGLLRQERERARARLTQDPKGE
jgi:hypothetical protein